MERKEDQLIALRTGAKPAERSGEYWSKADIQLSKQLYYGGLPKRSGLVYPPAGGGGIHPNPSKTIKKRSGRYCVQGAI